MKESRHPQILVVDDSTAVRRYIGELLSADGCEVTEAADGDQCLDRLARSVPDVVVLDVEMPGKSGLDVLNVIGPAPRLFSVILCTTRSSEKEIARGLDLGADDYIVKPFSDIALRARVRAAVRNASHKQALAEAQRETEAALAQLRAAQSQLIEDEKVAGLARLAAGTAHHINNPLGFVMSNLSTLGRYAAALAEHADRLGSALIALGEEGSVQDSESALRIRQVRQDLPYLLQETREGCGRIALIVQQLAQLELGLLSQESAELDLVTLVGPLVRMAEDLAPEGTDVRWLHPEETVLVRGSLSLLNAAILAVLKNACEALDTDAGTIRIELTATSDTARLLITDSGAGISDVAAGSLFDPFFSTKSPESHAGLGLTIARGFVTSQGGTISVIPLLHGTSVEIALPRLTSP